MSKLKELKKETPSIEEAEVLSAEEKKLIEEKRKINEEINNCGREIEAALINNNCTLLVDPNSPINNLRIMIAHKKEK